MPGRSSALPTASAGHAIMVGAVDGSLLSMVVPRGATDEGIETSASTLGMVAGRRHGRELRAEAVALVLAPVRRLVMLMLQVRDFRTTLVAGTGCARGAHGWNRGCAG